MKQKHEYKINILKIPRLALTVTSSLTLIKYCLIFFINIYYFNNTSKFNADFFKLTNIHSLENCFSYPILFTILQSKLYTYTKVYVKVQWNLSHGYWYV